MKLVYQSSGTAKDCMRACIATVLGLSLSEVPNFNPGVPAGKLLPINSEQTMDDWFAERQLSYVEFGFDFPLEVIQERMAVDLHGAPYLLTACSSSGTVHTVVCHLGAIVHDPGTEPGHHTITGPCDDGFYRIGIFLLNPKS